MSLRDIFVVLAVLAMFWVTESKDVGLEKRNQVNPTTIGDVAKILNEYATRESITSFSVDSRGLEEHVNSPLHGYMRHLERQSIIARSTVVSLRCKGTATFQDGAGQVTVKETIPEFKILAGRDGRDGQHGAQGPRGSPGSQGPRGVQGPMGHPGPKSGGVKYIRWGRTSCPSGANLVYKGRVGGERYTHTGGGSNYVCLTEAPKYASYTNVLKKYSAFMYGSEYQVHSTEHSNPFNNKNLHDHDVPCAVCFVPNRNTELMIPATYECPTGWSKEYWGYLMSEYYNHANQRNYICVDQDAEPVKGTIHNHDGALLYGVQGRCGSLPCLPYVEGRELTCVVCTK
ncbi:Short-chain collagen C4 [Exaiptasia diaphana]|nr:Short-chain collagen C4 [Exaiptasia diaphana]